MKRKISILSLCLLICATSYAVDNDHSKDVFLAVCADASEQAPTSVFFKDSAEMAEIAKATYCSQRNHPDFDLYDSILEVARKLGEEASDDGVEWDQNEALDRVGIEDLIESVREGSIEDKQITNVAYRTRSIDGPVRLIAGDLRSMPKDQDQCDQVVRAIVAGTDCNMYLKEFYEIYKHVHLLYASEDAALTAATLRQMNIDWSNFMEETIDQTPLELWWNGKRFRSKNTGYRGFVSPPKWQQILLKPYVAVDWSGEAPDGSEVKEAVVLDVWGIKRWSARELAWYKPIGGSIHIAASDRSNQDDWGVGLSVHFTEMHTVGVTSYGGDIGVFLSFDLWKNATDKYSTTQQRVDEFRMTKEEFESDPLAAFSNSRDDE